MSTISPAVRQKLRARLLTEERYLQFPYKDTAGYLTVGIGRNLSVVGVSVDEAFLLLDHDIENAEKDLWRSCSFYSSLDEIRKSVLIDMVFNMGIKSVIQFKEMISCLEKQDWKGAAKAMLDSEWAKQVGKRADRLALIMETGNL